MDKFDKALDRIYIEQIKQIDYSSVVNGREEEEEKRIE